MIEPLAVRSRSPRQSLLPPGGSPHQTVFSRVDRPSNDKGLVSRPSRRSQEGLDRFDVIDRGARNPVPIDEPDPWLDCSGCCRVLPRGLLQVRDCDQLILWLTLLLALGMCVQYASCWWYLCPDYALIDHALAVVFVIPVTILLWLLSTYDSSAGALEHEYQKGAARIREAYEERIGKVFEELRGVEERTIYDLQEAFAKAKQQLEFFIEFWRRIDVDSWQSAHFDLVSTSTRNSARTFSFWRGALGHAPNMRDNEQHIVLWALQEICSRWASTLSESLLDKNAQRDALLELGAHDTRQVSELLDRVEVWCSSRSFDLTMTRDAFHREGQNTTLMLEREFFECHRDLPADQVHRQGSARDEPQVRLCPCPCSPSAPDIGAVRACGVHLIHHLGVQFLIGLCLMGWYAVIAWSRFKRICNPPATDDYMQCESWQRVVDKMFACLCLLIYEGMLVRILFTFHRIVGPIKKLRLLQEMQSAKKHLGNRIQSLDQRNLVVAKMVHWRTSTIPRLYLMDWAFHQFRESIGVVLESSFPAQGKAQPVLVDAVQNLRWIFVALTPPGGLNEDFTNRETLLRLRQRVLAAPPLCNLFAKGGEIAEARAAQVGPELKNLDGLELNRPPPTMSMILDLSSSHCDPDPGGGPANIRLLR